MKVRCIRIINKELQYNNSMKHDIVFKTKEAFEAAQAVLIPHFACRFNDVNDYRIEFYFENRRKSARKLIKEKSEVTDDLMVDFTGN